jgi:hypothetical protein
MYRHLVRLILAGLACAALACSPKVVAGDASAGVDAVDVGMVDSLGDLADGEGEGIADAVGDATSEVDANADAITDATSDAAEVDAAPIALDCAADATPATADGFVLTDVGPLIPNPVFTGCGKGKPQPVAQPTQCGCDCPPPYSCYCNGECAWLRTPDPEVPHMNDRVVWTGKWVVAMATVYLGQNDKGEHVSVIVVERWNPSSTEGFEVIKNPLGDFKPPELGVGTYDMTLAPFGKTVALGVPYGYTVESKPNYPLEYSPKNPVHLLDVEAKTWSTVQMPNCENLRATKTHLVCIEPTWPNHGTVHLYEVATQKWTTSKVPAALLPADGLTYSKYADGRYFADDESFYAVDSVYAKMAWPDGSTFADGGHVLRYHVPTGLWSDVGIMPASWRKQAGYVGLDKNGLVRFPAPERLDFATKKVTVGPKGSAYSVGAPTNQPWIPLECGLLIPSTFSIPGDPNALYGRPIIIKPDLTVQLISPWGYPHDKRTAVAATLTDKEFISLGGDDGYGAPSHYDSYRFPISHLCKGAKP